MSDDFDLAHDKLPDQPVTIGGGKSAAAWHPNADPEVPHADLRDRIANALQDDIYACTRVWEAWQVGTMTADDFTPAWENEDVLDNIIAVLGDTVPREEHDKMFSLYVADANRMLRERDEARAERDALAHFREQVRHIMASGYGDIRHAVADLQEAAATAPAVSLALHDAEVKAQAVLDFAASYDSEWIGGGAVTRFAAARAAAIREEAGS